MIDKIKFQHHIIDKIYGFDNNNKIGKEVRIELLKNIIGSEFSKTSLKSFRDNSGNISPSDIYSLKNEQDKLIITKSLKQYAVTKDSNNPLVLKLFINDTYDKNTYCFYQELLFSNDSNNLCYNIITKCIDKETFCYLGYRSYDFDNILSAEKEYGFSWNCESSNIFKYENKNKVWEDLNNEQNNLYDKLVHEKEIILKK